MSEVDRTGRRAAVRRAVLHLVLGVMVLDALAMGAYYLAGVRSADTRTQIIFAALWTFSTAIVVAFLLRRVRLLRQGARSR